MGDKEYTDEELNSILSREDFFLRFDEKSGEALLSGFSTEMYDGSVLDIAVREWIKRFTDKQERDSGAQR